MKKLFANKKIALAILAIALGVSLMAAGLSGAWWYIAPDPLNPQNPAEFEMGELAVGVTLIPPVGAVYQPGENVYDCGISIENTGSIDAFIKLDFSGGHIWDDFDIIDGDAELYVKAYIDQETIDDAIDEDELDDIIEVTGGDGRYCLYKDAADDIFYLSIAPDVKVTFIDCITVEFIGGDDTAPYADLDGEGPNSDGDQGMNNAFMKDKIYITLNWEATQMKQKAISAKFELDFTLLDIIIFG